MATMNHRLGGLRSGLGIAAHNAFLIAACLGAAATASAQGGAAKGDFESVPGQYVVSVKASATRLSQRALSQALGGAILEQVREGVLLIQRPAGERPQEAMRGLSASRLVQLAEPNYIYRATRTPNDPKYGGLWGLNNVGQADSQNQVGSKGIDIEAEKAWDVETGSKNTVVAVIDTGVDFTIPDLRDNAWINLPEFNGKPGVDDDNNGYVDDINGYDFVNNKGAVVDDNGHGSHCAGTIAARGNDGIGVAGVSWNASVMAVKFLDKDGGGTLANSVKAIDYARKNGAKVMSNSWGGGAASDILKKAIEDARDAGSLFVAAAGNNSSDNDSSPSYPASYPTENIVSIAAVDNQGSLARFSNYGARTVHLAAPGVNILSTAPLAIDPSGFQVLSGTSMATPHASGVAALVLSHEPTLGYKDLRDRLIRSARPLAGLRGKVASGGMLDAYLAVTGQMAPPDVNDPVNWKLSKAFAASSPHPYVANYKQEVTASVPGAKRVAVHFAKFQTEALYDFVEFFDKAGRSLGKSSGHSDGIFSPPADGDAIVLRFTSDDSVNDYGFDVDSISYQE